MTLQHNIKWLSSFGWGNIQVHIVHALGYDNILIGGDWYSIITAERNGGGSGLFSFSFSPTLFRQHNRLFQNWRSRLFSAIIVNIFMIDLRLVLLLRFYSENEYSVLCCLCILLVVYLGCLVFWVCSFVQI